jgi:hypothetical protein
MKGERDMQITTTPSCRVGSEGQTLHYVVRAEGATTVSVPGNGAEAMQARIVSTRPVGDGIEAQLEVKVLDSTLY